ncbi:hypothetical protein [Plantactinospora sp. CA-290183]|uniref:hypothetical protein n=1 Tax=Plantactinospora sp. CA-290183 TaxID=3240006 RepID=UPI003D8ACA0D
MTRRSTRLAIVAAAVSGLMLTQQACTTAGTGGTPAGTSAPVSPSESAAEATGSAGTGSKAVAPASDEAILKGERQILIHLVEEDKDLSATFEGPITTGPGTDDGARFRLVPSGDAYLIETLRPVEFEGPFCVVVKADTEPATLSTAKCEPTEQSLFLVAATGKKDDKGRTTYHIKNDKHGFVQWSDSEQRLYVQQVGDAAVQGSFSFVDRGAN